MKPAGEALIIIPFHDVDMMQITWHGHYYKYFEVARTELLRGGGIDLDTLHQTGYLLPVIESFCRYIAPCRYGMRVLVKATLKELEYRIKIDYLLTEEGSGKKLARGYTIQVAVHDESKDMCFNTPAPICRLLDPSGVLEWTREPEEKT